MTSVQAYQAKQTKIATLLEEFKTKLANHATNQAQEPKNWGYVGDLDHAEELLRRAIQSV